MPAALLALQDDHQPAAAIQEINGRSSAVDFPDPDGLGIAGGAGNFTGAAAVAFVRIDDWIGDIPFFIPIDADGIEWTGQRARIAIFFAQCKQA